MRVLIIEDEARIVTFVREALEQEGIEVASAFDGAAGLQAAIDGSFDLVVLDLRLPRMSGLAVLEALRAAKPDLPVLILSARTDIATKLRGFELGAADYVPKPFVIEEFLARVRVHLRRASDFDSVILRAGGFELDLVRRQARVDDVVAELSDREFAVLRCLASAAGTVVGREQLLSDVWGFDFNPGTNVVDVCVRRLRKKLGPRTCIETVRNAGYRVPTLTGAISTDGRQGLVPMHRGP